MKQTNRSPLCDIEVLWFLPLSPFKSCGLVTAYGLSAKKFKCCTGTLLQPASTLLRARQSIWCHSIFLNSILIRTVASYCQGFLFPLVLQNQWWQQRSLELLVITTLSQQLIIFSFTWSFCYRVRRPDSSPSEASKATCLLQLGTSSLSWTWFLLL